MVEGQPVQPMGRIPKIIFPLPGRLGLAVLPPPSALQQSAPAGGSPYPRSPAGPPGAGQELGSSECLPRRSSTCLRRSGRWTGSKTGPRESG